MIRVNLLNPIGNREGRVESLIRTGGTAAFISRREVVLGLGCLVLAAGVLVFQYGGSTEEAPKPPEETPVVWTPQQPLIRDIDAEYQAKSSETVETPNSDDTAGQAASAAGVDQAASGGAIASNPTEPAASTKIASAPSPAAQPAVSPATPTAPSGAAAVLQQLVVSAEGEQLRIFAATGMQPEFSTFQLDNPKRIVIDMPGVRLTLPREQQDQKPAHSQVTRIRAGQYQQNPPKARIVLDVTSYPEVEALPQFNGLYLIVTEHQR